MVRGSSMPVRVLVEIVRRTGDLAAVADMYPHLGRERIEGALADYAVCRERVDEDVERNAKAWAEHQAALWPA